MKQCELCDRAARMHCDSDQASLCLACDTKVHSANFLVARHSRTLLCQACQLPTPWRAAGARLCPAVSVCVKCVGRCTGIPALDAEVESGERMIGVEEGEEEAGDEDDVEAEDVEEEEEEEDGENQVVPWTSSLSGPAASPSSEEEESSRRTYDHGRAGANAEIPSAVWMKRRPEHGDFLHQESVGCSSSPANFSMADDESTSSGPSRPPKERKKTSGDSEAAAGSRILQKETLDGVEGTTVKLSKDRLSIVDLSSNVSQNRPM